MSPSNPTARSIIADIIASYQGTLEWVARALCMGGAANVGHYVRTRPWRSVRRKGPKAMLRFIEREADDLR